jgi:hypothetical protein
VVLAELSSSTPLSGMLSTIVTVQDGLCNCFLPSLLPSSPSGSLHGVPVLPSLCVPPARRCVYLQRRESGS